MPLKQGTRLPTVAEYAQFLMPIDFERADATINLYGATTESDTDLVLAVQTGQDRYRFMPGPEFSPRLYRGQIQLDDSEPCIPSLYRQPRRIDSLYWVAKTIELFGVLAKHPASLELAAFEIEGLTFDFNIEALAQHYQYPTALLDFSRSKEVAMFFATCSYDAETGNCLPRPSGSNAVLYTADLRALILHREGHSKLLPLGLEPLPRPKAQRAMAIKLSPSENLHEMPWIQRTPIEITPDLSKRYCERFNEGRTLFPVNAFDQHIQILRTNRTVPTSAIEFGMAHGWLPPHPQGIAGAVGALKAAGYSVTTNSGPDIDQSVLDAASLEWLLRRAGYFGRVRMRGVCDHLVPPRNKRPRRMGGA